MDRLRKVTRRLYRADYSDEVDSWIRRVEEDAAHAKAAWQRERNLLGRRV